MPPRVGIWRTYSRTDEEVKVKCDWMEGENSRAGDATTNPPAPLYKGGKY